MHILRILPALIARIPTAHIVRPVRRRPTAVIVQPLTAALIIQRLVLKPEELGTVLTAKCRNRQAPLTAAPLRILPPLVLKPEELGTARLALCRTRQATTMSRAVLWRVWDNFSKRYSVCLENKAEFCQFAGAKKTLWRGSF